MQFSTLLWLTLIYIKLILVPNNLPKLTIPCGFLATNVIGVFSKVNNHRTVNISMCLKVYFIHCFFAHKPLTSNKQIVWLRRRMSECSNGGFVVKSNCSAIYEISVRCIWKHNFDLQQFYRWWNPLGQSSLPGILKRVRHWPRLFWKLL